MTIHAELATRRHLLERLTIGLILAHIGMAAIHFIRRAVPASPPLGAPDEVEPLLHLAALVHWSGWHIATAFLLTGCMILVTDNRTGPRLRHRAIQGISIAAHLSLLLWLSWGALVAAWAWWSIPPASLVTPLLLAVFAVPVSYMVSEAWIDREE